MYNIHPLSKKQVMRMPNFILKAEGVILIWYQILVTNLQGNV